MVILTYFPQKSGYNDGVKGKEFVNKNEVRMLAYQKWNKAFKISLV